MSPTPPPPHTPPRTRPQALHAYSVAVAAAVSGRGEALSVSELSGGARIHHILHGVFVAGLMALDPTQNLSDDEIRTAIQNAAGTKAAILIPEEPFELLAKKAISAMTDPCHRCAALVYEEANSNAAPAGSPLAPP